MNDRLSLFLQVFSICVPTGCMSAPGPQTLIRSQRSMRTGSAWRLPTPQNDKDAKMIMEEMKFEFKKKKKPADKLK